jgi:4-amino-4-deoxy-L-arabinose transferase-like glycosyltransferase
VSATTLTPPRTTVVPAPAETPGRRPRTWSRLVLLALLALQVGLAVLPRRNQSPFEDEGLYVYMGHRMLEHLLDGARLTEYPGAYFSGAPGLYPVLAALGDSVAGLPGARAVSLAFALAATVCVNGLGRQLYGTRAGLLGATAFVLCGSVVFQSGLATFDSTTLFLVAAAAWLTVYSVRHDAFLWAPAVALLLVLAAAAKYGGVAYVPVIALLAVAVGDRRHRLVVLRRAAFAVLAWVVVAFAAFSLWGQSLREGILSTTVSREPMNPAGPALLVEQVLTWVGPWLALAVVGAVVAAVATGRDSWAPSLALLAGSVIAPAQQVLSGEATSLAKHVAFGMVFACPLVGSLLATLSRRLRYVTVPLVAATLVALGLTGLHHSDRFLNGWVPNDSLVPVLRTLAAASPGKAILGDQPSAERYLLREDTEPLQWVDTYSFSYAGLSGLPAYEQAIEQSAFGVIYVAVESNTENGAAVGEYLRRNDTPYRQVTVVERTLYGEPAGVWVLYVPEVTPVPDLGGAASPGPAGTAQE